MEETHIIHNVNFFISSNQIQQINIQVFTLQDQLIECFSLKNYSAHTIRLDKDLICFYCIATCPTQLIEEQFQCDFSENNKENDKIDVVKSFNEFKLKIESEIIKQYQIVTDDSSPQKQHAYLYQIAVKNLKNLQKKIMKKMQLDQLAKPIQPKFKKSNLKFKGFNKSKTNMIVTRFKESGSLSKISERTQKKQTVKATDSFYIDSENEDKKYIPRTRKNIRGGKHFTCAVNLVCASDTVSTGTVEAEQVPQPELQQYQRIYQAVNQSLSKLNNKFKKVRNTYGSVLEQIARQAHEQIENQKQFLKVIHGAADHLRSTRTQRPTSLLKIRTAINSPRSILKPKGVKIVRRRKVL